MVWTCKKRGRGGVLRKVEKIPGRPKGTLEQLVQKDMKKRGLKEEQVMDRKTLKRLIKGKKGLQAKIMIMKLTFMST